MKIKNAPSQVERVMTAPTASQKPVMTRTENERKSEGQRERIPFGQASLKLAATGIPGYHLHWINDWHPSMPNRIEQALKAGYQFVTVDESDTTPLLGGNTTADLSNRVSRIVGTRTDGQPITQYLMKIPEEFHLEHQQPVWDRADKVDAAIRGGKIKRSDEDLEGRYVPGGKQTIKLTTKLEQGESDG